MPPDASAVDAALLAKLNGDVTLAAFAASFFDVAPSGSTKYVLVSLLDSNDEPMQGGTAFEEGLYQVKAVEKSNSSVTVKAAAARIHELLEQQPLVVAGYAHMMTRRAGRVRATETDSIDKDIQWQHRGGRYEVFVSAP